LGFSKNFEGYENRFHCRYVFIVFMGMKMVSIAMQMGV